MTPALHKRPSRLTWVEATYTALYPRPRPQQNATVSASHWPCLVIGSGR